MGKDETGKRARSAAWVHCSNAPPRARKKYLLVMGRATFGDAGVNCWLIQSHSASGVIPPKGFGGSDLRRFSAWESDVTD